MRYAIIGASSGIGAALAARLAADGHTVYAGARRVGHMRHLFADAPTVQPLYCDATRPESVQAFWRHIGWAGSLLDGLVVTVGAQGEINRVADSDPAAWWATVATNLYGPYLAVRYGVPHLAPTARLVLCAGGGAHTPWPHYAAYACAKAGVVRLVETLAQELPQPVNALAPGFCPTMIHHATLTAGPERAGTAGWQRAHEAHLLREMAVRLEQPLPGVREAVACACWLLQDAPAALTGRTISAQHDPWATDPAVLMHYEYGTTQRSTARAVEVAV